MKSDLISYPPGGKRQLWRWADPDQLLLNGRPVDWREFSGSTMQTLQALRPRYGAAHEVAYHLTLPQHWMSINQSGLLAHKPRGIENPKGVYLFSSQQRALAAGDHRHMMLEVDISELLLRADRLVDEAFYVTGDIARERLRVVDFGQVSSASLSLS